MSTLLHWVEWHYNTKVYSATGFLYPVVYGRVLPSFPQYILGSPNLEAIHKALATKGKILTKFDNLLKAQKRMKKNADKHIMIFNILKEIGYI